MENKMMRKIFIILFIILAVWGLQALLSRNEKDTEVGGYTDSTSSDNSTNIEELDIKAEKIEVVHFHATQQCWSCIELGRLAQKSLEITFPEELESGKIEFFEVNVDSPENSEIVQRYRAVGSSLFINIIYDGQDHITEDVQVWRLLNSESQFRKYLGDKLEDYI